MRGAAGPTGDDRRYIIAPREHDLFITDNDYAQGNKNISRILYENYYVADNNTDYTNKHATMIGNPPTGSRYTFGRGNQDGQLGKGGQPGQNMWVAVGSGTLTPPLNSIAYSYDGIHWTGLGTDIFGSGGFGIAWNGRMWVAVGDITQGGAGVFAYSYDGIHWMVHVLGNYIFTIGNGVAWNGRMWVAVGGGVGSGTSNSIAYSYDGIHWTGLGKNIFSYNGQCVAWNGRMWVAVGYGSANTIAYSYDGIQWTGVTDSSSNIFTYYWALASHGMDGCGWRLGGI